MENKTLTILVGLLIFITQLLTAQTDRWIYNNLPTVDLAVQDGNIYTAATITTSMDVDPADSTEYIIEPIVEGVESCYVLKQDEAGQFLWSIVFGNGGTVAPQRIESYSDGVYILGYFNGTVDFDPGPGEFNLTETGSGTSAFVVKFDNDGNFQWVKKWSYVSFSLHGMKGDAFVVDQHGDLYVINDFGGTWEICDDEYQNGGGPLWLTKFSAQNGTCIFNTQVSSWGDLNAPEIVFDGTGHLYVAMQVDGYSAGFPGPNGNITVLEDQGGAGNGTAVIKLDMEGNVLWAKGYEAEYLDEIHYSNGNLYMVGRYRGLIDFNPDPILECLKEPTLEIYNFYLLQLDSLGDFKWVTTHFGKGGTSFEEAYIRGSGTTPDGDLIISGEFETEVDLMPGDGVALYEAENNNYRGFLMRFNSAGELVWLELLLYLPTQWGSIHGQTLIVDDYNNLYLKGYNNTPTMEVNIEGYSYESFRTQGVVSSYHFLIKHPLCQNSTESIFLNNDCAPQEVNGIIYEDAGTFYQSFLNAAGCDSTLVIVVEHPESSGYLLIDDFCAIDTLINGVNYSSEGIYTQSLTAVDGCDSVLTIEIVLSGLILTDSINLVDGTLQVYQENAIYEWINCETNLPIPAETGINFTPTISGNYAANIIQNGCLVQTNCVQVTIVSTEDLSEQSQMSVYPTIFNDRITVSFPQTYDIQLEALTLFNSQGVDVSDFITKTKAGNVAFIESNAGLPKGVYFVIYSSEHGSFVEKVLRM